MDCFQDTEEQFDSFEVKSRTPAKTKNFRNANNSVEIIEIEKRKLELLEKKTNRKNERDEDESFFDSLLPHIRKLEPGQKFLCRMDIQNTIYRHVYNTPQQYERSSPVQQFHPILRSLNTTPISSDPTQYIISSPISDYSDNYSLDQTSPKNTIKKNRNM